MNNFINNKGKVIFIAIMFLFTLLCINNVCYGASDVNVTLSNGEKFVLKNYPDELLNKKIFFLLDSNGKTIVNFYAYDKEEGVYYDSSDGRLIFPASVNCYTYAVSDWVYTKIVEVRSSQVNMDSAYYSSVDINDSNGEVVFRKAPQGQGTLAQIVEQTKPQEKTLAEVVGILPIVIVVIVSLIGCLKALRMLLALLKNS